MGVGEDLGPLAARDKRVGGGALNVARFCNFSIKVLHFYAYFDQNTYLKTITH